MRASSRHFSAIGMSLFLALFSVYPALAATPNDPLFDRQRYLRDVGMPEAWDFAKGSPAVTVAVFDSGVDLSHPDLRDRIWTNPNEVVGNGVDDDKNGYVDDMHGWDFVSNDNDPNPDTAGGASIEGANHGTVVAGIIAAAGSNAEGVTGVNWNGSILPLRTLDSTGLGTTDKLEDAIRYAINAGAKVFNFSFNGETFSTTLQDVLRDAERRGIVIVTAAGNEGDTAEGGNLNANPNWPVCFKKQDGTPLVIGVASLERNGKKSSFSSYGSNCVGLSAPGENYFGTQVYRPGDPDFSEPYGNGWSGTSLAAPLVSGTAALLFSMKSDFTNADIRAFLTSTAKDISAQNGSLTAGLGAGMLDAAAAIQAAQQAILSGGTTNLNASATLLVPNGGETFTSGQTSIANWSWQGSRVRFARITYVPTVGEPTILRDMADAMIGSATWFVPFANGTVTGKLRLDLIDSGGTVLASDLSDNPFTIQPASGATTQGYDYNPAAVRTSVMTIDQDKGLTGNGHPNCATGTRIKGSLSSVYYCGADGKRYGFTDDKSYFSWYTSFAGIRTVSDATLASIPFGGSVTYKPGVRMIKLQTSPRTYVVDRGGILREIPDEAAAAAMYGPKWNTLIDDISDAFFPLYRLGEPVKRL